MSSFNLHRFGRLLAYDLRTRRKAHLSQLAGLFCAIFFIEMGNMVSPRGQHLLQVVADDFYQERAAMQVFFFYFCLAASFGIAFSHLKTKTARIAFLLRPASNLEKYLSCLLQSTVLFFVLYVAALFLADGARIALMAIRGGDTTPLAPMVMAQFADVIAEPSQVVVNQTDVSAVYTIWTPLFPFLYVGWIYSLFLLGSAVFRRYAPLRTFLILLVIHLVLGASLDMADRSISLSFHADNVETDVVPLIGTVFIVLILFNLWYSYRRFCRLQVVSRPLFSLK